MPRKFNILKQLNVWNISVSHIESPYGFHLKLESLGKLVNPFLPVQHSFFQFLQEIAVELIQLRQVVQDLI